MNALASHRELSCFWFFFCLDPKPYIARVRHTNEGYSDQFRKASMKSRTNMAFSSMVRIVGNASDLTRDSDNIERHTNFETGRGLLWS